MQLYPWYEVVDLGEPLEQGDFVEKCPIVIPPAQVKLGQTVDAQLHRYRVVVLSQSCDLIYRKIDIVLVSPVWPLAEMQDVSDTLASTEGREQLKRGNLPGYHLLNECQLGGFARGLQVVDFTNVYGVDFGLLQATVEQQGHRVRLLPPYREHLSQAFARFFMRVGLPVDIAPFEKPAQQA